MNYSELSLFFSTHNHWDRYDDWLGSYTPAAIFSFNSSTIFFLISGGMGMFENAHGTWSIAGMMYSEK